MKTISHINGVNGMRVFKEEKWTIPRVAEEMRRNAMGWVYDGSEPTPETKRRKSNSVAQHYPTNTSLVFGRDRGHHTLGGWKSPEVERCFHLSLSFVDMDKRIVKKTESGLVQLWLRSFFGDALDLVWAEPPGNEAYDMQQWHFRLFCDETWNPLEKEPVHMQRELRAKGYVRASEIIFVSDEPRVPTWPVRLWKRLWIS